jgi:TonB family protein
LIVSRSNPQDPIPFYSIGAIDWIRLYDRNNLLEPAEQSAVIEEGLSYLDQALALNPQYGDAMVYKNLLLREKARLAVDLQEQARLRKLADEWFNRALEIRKSKAESAGGAGRAVGPNSGNIKPLPPPLSPAPPRQPQSNPGASGRVRVGSNIAAVNLIHSVPPVYPQLAKDERIEGVVTLEATINKDGTVENLNVINGHPLLIQPAVEAVKQWVYTPVLLNGEPVGVVTTLSVNFALAH